MPYSSDNAKKRLVAVLADRLDAVVELQDLQVRALPSLRAEGHGLMIRHRGRRDVPPLISVAHFSAEGNLANLLHRHLSRLDLDGLVIQIPPDRNHDQRGASKTRDDKGDEGRDPARTLTIDHLYATDAQLSIIPKETGRLPRVWDIHRLHMQSVSADTSMPFDATLTNAVPPGEIGTRGTFGPWDKTEPGDTPLDGVFTFDRADLGVFKGLSGLLKAHGRFGGQLARIEVDGETDTPDFKVQTGRAVPLHTRYHALVDGTNGNTLLSKVDATFLGTFIVAKGGVIGVPHKSGRTVTLDVTIGPGRLEDVLRLAIKDPKAPMTGALQLTTHFVLPPGDRDVVQKLHLDGTFSIVNTRFTNLDVQHKISELSQRSRGRVREAEAPRSSASRFNGRFKLSDGRLSIPKVTFDVPGSLVELGGTYGLVTEDLSFQGTLFMDVKVSQTTTGVKSLLLKVVDPLFRRDGGGSAIPIRISGTRSDPAFGLDKGRLFSGRRAGQATASTMPYHAEPSSRTRTPHRQ